MNAERMVKIWDWVALGSVLWTLFSIVVLVSELVRHDSLPTIVCWALAAIGGYISLTFATRQWGYFRELEIKARIAVTESKIAMTKKYSAIYAQMEAEPPHQVVVDALPESIRSSFEPSSLHHDPDLRRIEREEPALFRDLLDHYKTYQHTKYCQVCKVFRADGR